MKPLVEASDFTTLAANLAPILLRSDNASPTTRQRRFKALFGASPIICAKVWTALIPSLPGSASPIHLLWTLYFLKQYGKEEVNASFAQCTEKTYRKWCWIMIRKIAELELVSQKTALSLVFLDLRLKNYVLFRFSNFLFFHATQIEWENRYLEDNGSQCLVSVDGTDFSIMEPMPFNKKWFSHKMNGPGVRYEVAICIQTGEPVWINGPFPCGSWSDLRIARSALVDALDPGEYYLADGGYRDGNQWSVTPTGRHLFSDRQKSVVRARHESYNKRLKDWGALRQLYRHRLETHSQVFRAIANIVHIAISHGETLFQVDYHV